MPMNAQETSYEELSGMRSTELPERATSVVRRLYEARRKPLNELSFAEIRLLLNRNHPTELPLVPEVVMMALEILENNVLLEADYYPGDLLYTVLKLPVTFWATQPSLAERLTLLLQKTRADLDRLLEGSMKRDLPELADSFLASRQN